MLNELEFSKDLNDYLRLYKDLPPARFNDIIGRITQPCYPHLPNLTPGFEGRCKKCGCNLKDNKHPNFHISALGFVEIIRSIFSVRVRYSEEPTYFILNFNFNSCWFICGKFPEIRLFIGKGYDPTHAVAHTLMQLSGIIEPNHECQQSPKFPIRLETNINPYHDWAKK